MLTIRIRTTLTEEEHTLTYEHADTPMSVVRQDISAETGIALRDLLLSQREELLDADNDKATLQTLGLNEDWATSAQVLVGSRDKQRKSISIFYQPQWGTDLRVIHGLRPDATVENLCDAVQADLKMPHGPVRLIRMGKPLRDSEVLLVDCGLFDGAFVREISHTFRGG